MLKRAVSLLLSFLLILPFTVSKAELEEEDWFFEDYVEQTEDKENEVIDPDGSRYITVTCTGDLTVGGDNYHHKGKLFYTELEKNSDNISFTMVNVRDIFRSDDLTLVNFEGTFTDTKFVPNNKKGNEFLFNISPKYVSILTDNFIEAVCLENNHVMDHGEEGYNETKEMLQNAGVLYSTSTEMAVFDVKGIQIAMLSYLCIDRYDKPVGEFATLYDKVASDIQLAKKYYPVVIVSFHWGREKDYHPTDNQKKMGRLAVDSGADLVIGHHSHRINPIEQYNGVYICYSLGNFCFSGNEAPSDMTSFIFQTRFKMTKSGDVTNTGFRVIPIRITSIRDKNDCVPTPITDDFKIDGIITMLKDNGNKYLEYPVAEYPLEWNN